MIKNGLNIVWTGKELLQKIRERYSLLWFPGIQYNYGNTGIRRTLWETVTYFRLSGLCPPTYIHLRTIYGTNYNFASNGVGCEWVGRWMAPRILDPSKVLAISRTGSVHSIVSQVASP